MNQQIRELEKQCWSHYVNGVLIDGHLHFDVEKFAQLIVRECVKVMYDNAIERKVGLEIDKRPTYYAAAILEHFGVK